METSTAQIAADAIVIEELGGPAKVATALGWPNPKGCRRVSNWLKRGIPPAVKLQYPGMFLGAVAARASAKVAQAPSKAEA